MLSRISKRNQILLHMSSDLTPTFQNYNKLICGKNNSVLK